MVFTIRFGDMRVFKKQEIYSVQKCFIVSAIHSRNILNSAPIGIILAVELQILHK